MHRVTRAASRGIGVAMAVLSALAGCHSTTAATSTNQNNQGVSAQVASPTPSPTATPKQPKEPTSAV